MELILWRHAHAIEGEVDLLRPLSSKGEHQAAEVAAWLNQNLPDNTRILVSPARRTQQTAHALGRIFETCEAIAPFADGAALLQTANWPNELETVLLIGHQPALGQAVSLLLGANNADMAVKKGGLWWFSWREKAPQLVVRMVLSPELI